MSGVAPGTVVDDRYVVDGLLARGGWAAVYRVRHLALGTPFALKVLESATPQVRDRATVEARAHSRLRHPNVVFVTDTCTIDGMPGLVMEYVPGPTLAALMKLHRLEQPEIDDVAAGLFAGVAAAHAAGLVHRDLKPQNVLLAPAGERFVPKIADFGLVKILDAAMADRPSVATVGTIGTPRYMAPEQVGNTAGVDHRADLYSLGVMLYELLSGVSPYRGDLADVLRMVVVGERASTRAVAPGAPDRCVEAVERALARAPEDRPESVEALARMWFGEAGPPPPARWRPALLALEGPQAVTPASPTRARRRRTAEAAPLAKVMPDRSVPDRSVLRAALGVLAVALTVAAGGGGVAAGVAWATWTDPGRTPPSLAATSPEPSPVQPPVEPAAGPGEPRTGPRPAPTPSRPAPDPPASAPAPDAPPAPAPSVAAPPPPEVNVTGADGITVALRDASTGLTVDPGAAGPGAYDVLAFFQPLAPTLVGRIELVPGARVAVRCSVPLRKCVVAEGR